MVVLRVTDIFRKNLFICMLACGIMLVVVAMCILERS